MCLTSWESTTSKRGMWNLRFSVAACRCFITGTASGLCALALVSPLTCWLKVRFQNRKLSWVIHLSKCCNCYTRNRSGCKGCCREGKSYDCERRERPAWCGLATGIPTTSRWAGRAVAVPVSSCAAIARARTASSCSPRPGTRRRRAGCSLPMWRPLGGESARELNGAGGNYAVRLDRWPQHARRALAAEHSDFYSGYLRDTTVMSDIS